MMKEAFLWRSSKHLESQTLINLCHRLNVDIMYQQCSIGSASIDRVVICMTTSNEFISELEKSDKAKTDVHNLVSSSMLPVFDRLDTGQQ